MTCLEPGISVIVHTRNSAATLPKLLRSIRWADECIAVDMESQDETAALLEGAGANINTIPLSSWNDSLRNPWLSEPRHEWTLVLDSDEFVADDSEGNFRWLAESADEQTMAFAIPRFNFCFGRLLTGDRWYPDPQIRFFRTGTVRYQARHHVEPSLVVDGVVVRGDWEKKPHIHHQHYPSVEQFVERQVRYLLTDDYERPVDFDGQMREALAAMKASLSAPSDQERALELLLAYNHLAAGFVHWERTGFAEALPRGYGWVFSPKVAEAGQWHDARPNTGFLHRIGKRIQRAIQGFRS